jgi:hypothetical protein
MSALENDLLALEPSDHAVHFYGLDGRALASAIGPYLLRGLQSDEAAIVIARPAHCETLQAYLDDAGLDTRHLRGGRKLQTFDADETLDRFMVGGQPDADRFDATVGNIVRAAAAAAPGLHAYGEMVGLLWDRGQYPAAIRLEQLWHRLMAETKFTLLCAYGVDLLDPNLEIGLLDALFCAHTHLLPGEAPGDLSEALELAIKDLLGRDGDRIAREAANFAPRRWSRLPKTEAMILFLRKNMPNRAAEIFERAKEHYRAFPSAS